MTIDRDITWIASLDAGLEAARQGGRPVLVHPCGQGIGLTDDL